ncbi:MAG TPA: fibronectin type III domain-containing protein, partial [Candidatus Thermoplasmatota archaeon]|nr:fibronectin type III domain-containing protein [Candidatus Thermoplasmatota archaeon]
MASYSVAAAVFIAGMTVLLSFAMDPPGATVNLEQADLKSKGEAALDLLLGSPGYPVSWSTAASGADGVTRLGLVQSGTSIRLDPAKFDALARGRYLDPSSTNGYVDYAEAKDKLGLEGYDFHLRAFPALQSGTFSQYGVEGLDAYHVGYVGACPAGVINATATIEVAALNALEIGFQDARRTLDADGSLFCDSSSELRDHLVPLLGAGVPQSVISQGSGTPKHDFARLNATVLDRVLHHQENATGLTTALGLSSNGALGYNKGREIRATLGVANFSAVAVSTTLSWKEYVDSNHGAAGGDSGDYGYVEVSADGGRTWIPITSAAGSRSEDTASSAQTSGWWRNRTATIGLAECAACLGADEVIVALHWVADNDNNVGYGWIVDSVSIALTGFAKTFENPEFDLLIVGSEVSQTAMTAAEVKNAVRDYVTDYGGRLVVLGGDQSTNWLEPLFHTGIRDSSGGVGTPDLTHPLLTVPNELDYESYTYGGQEWTFSGGADEDLFTMVVGTSGGHVLSVSKPSAFGSNEHDGAVILTTYLPYTMTSDQAARFMANSITYGMYHSLYLEMGPEVPTDGTVASVVRSATMDRTRNGSGLYTDIAFVLYVWRGDTDLTGAAALTVPTAATSFTATAGDARVDLAWTPSTPPPGVTITGFKIWRGTQYGVSTLLASVPSGIVSYADTSVVNGVTYYYNLTATSSGGDGYSTSPISVTPATTPGAPNAPSVLAVANRHVVSWSAPASGGGSAITNYTLAISTGGGPYVASDVGNVLSHEWTVAAGTTYDYKVRASNAMGDGPYSGSTSASTVSLPNQVAGLTATGALGSVQLAWTSVPGATGYAVYRGATSGATAEIARYDGINTTWTDAGLNPGTTRFYRVSALNAFGEGTLSDEKSATTIALPNQVTGLAATGVLNGIQLAWTAAAQADGYVLYRGTASGSLTEIARYAGSNVTWQDLTVPAEATRHYAVAAWNAVGDGPQSAEASATALGTPSAPTIAAAPATGQGAG